MCRAAIEPQAVEAMGDMLRDMTTELARLHGVREDSVRIISVDFGPPSSRYSDHAHSDQQKHPCN